MRPIHVVVPVAALTTLVVGPRAGVAQEDTSLHYKASFDPEQFAASVDPDAIGLVDGARTQPRGALGVGLMLHFAGPELAICVRDASSSNPDCQIEGDILNARLRADLGVLYGLGRFDVRIALPLVLHQSTDFAPPEGDPSLASIGVGDPRVGVRVQLARPGPFSLAADLAASIPIGTGNFMGDGGFVVDPRLLFDVRKGRFAFGLDAGYRLRRAAQLADLYVDDEVTWSAGVEYWLARRKVALGAAAYGRIGVVDEPADPTGGAAMGTPVEERPAEALGSLRVMVTPRIAVDVGGGAAIADGYGAAPFRVVAGVRWLPPKETGPHAVHPHVVKKHIVTDRDHDGVDDSVDQCAANAEDLDGWEDADGCPDPDNDDDGILDVDDKCPLVAEDDDGFQDDDGCPDSDNDGDGIADADDRCPNQAEDKDGFQDDDGCPETDDDRDGDGVPDGSDKCPDQPEDVDGIEDSDGCPETDGDGDGIADAQDACPTEAEDMDHIQDDDGCPETDADHDGIVDTADKCPTKAEVFNGVDDEDGCPDVGRTVAVVTGDAIVIDERVFFDLNRARVKTRAHPVLDAVAGILKAHSDLRIRIEGNADDQGPGDWNQTLSQMRAERVRAYLIKQGIEPDRLEAKGNGSDQPLVNGTSDDARSKNRRVEFVIIGRTTDGDAPSTSPPATPPPATP